MLKYISYNLIFYLFLVNSIFLDAVYASQDRLITVALNDLPGIDMLAVLTAFERVKQKGVNIEVKYLQSEGIAAQAIIAGKADIGMGTPYKVMQKTQAPIRMFFQLNRLRFYPVANSDMIKSWKDLDGEPMITHGEGSGTEAMMNMLAKKNGIQFIKMNYIPGSGVRARALIRKQIKATIVDIERRNMLLSSKKGNFKVLPMEDINASDEALYANKDFIRNNQELLKTLIEELQYVWKKMIESPQFIVDAQNKYNLIPQLGSEKNEEILKFYTEMVNAGAFPTDGGSKEAFTKDKEFYGFAGTLDTTRKLEENDFWDLRILREILKH